MKIKKVSENLSIAFVGDMSFGDSLFCQGFGVRSLARQKGHDFLFTEVQEILKKSDIVFGNLETVLSQKGENLKSLNSVNMRGDPECAYALKNAGFTVLNLANNHSMQHGIAPFSDTVELLNTIDVQVVGLRSDDDAWYSRPVILQSAGLKIGFIGYAFEADRYYKKRLPYAFGIKELIEEDIKKLRPLVDILIISNHWGVEVMDRPSVSTIRMARQMVDMGADIVIGHHPHVLQGIEYYKEKIIAYSLGNFIFDMGWNDRYRESVIFKVNFDSEGKMTYEIVPVMIKMDGQPIPVYGKEADKISNCIERLSSKINAEMDGTVEYNNLRYYNEYRMIIKKSRFTKYRYFLANFHRYKKGFILQQLGMTIRSRLEDFGIIK